MSASARERIRAAAIELFTEKGYAATATREICQRARVTKPVLYYHFQDKEHLYREIVLSACHDAFQELAAAASGPGSARQRLVNVLAADFAQTRSHPKLATLHFRLIFSPRQGAPRIDYVELGLHWLRLLTRIVRQGIRDGEIRGNAKRLGEAILGLHTIYTMSFLLRGRPALGRPLARHIVGLVCPPAGSEPNRRSS